MSPRDTGSSFFHKGKVWHPDMGSAVVSSSGYHQIVLDGYSDTKHTPTGKSIDSVPFTSGGYRWVLKYYPNGSCPETADFISILVSLDQEILRPMKVLLKFSSKLQYFSLNQVVPTPLAEARTSVFSSGRMVLGFDKLIKRIDFEKSRLMGNNHITIQCDINVVADTSVPTPLLEEVPPSDIRQHIADLLLSKEGADVTFQVGGEKFTAHRCILAARSAVFKAELFGSMKEGGTAYVIQIIDMESKVFGAMLSFIYTDSLPKMETYSMDEGEVEEGKGEESMWLQSLLVAADRYDILRMKLICENKLRECIDVTTVSGILTLAEQHNCPGLKEACLEFLKIPTNLEKVLMADGLDHIVQTCPSRVKELLSKFAS
ncbi:BTB/POZ and MATH domain-containing protein 1-like [Triticum aestivum]|nr:BTB/POZ and MATH domain-containing protein 1-like [Triticum aestivum]